MSDVSLPPGTRVTWQRAGDGKRVVPRAAIAIVGGYVLHDEGRIAVDYCTLLPPPVYAPAAPGAVAPHVRYDHGHIVVEWRPVIAIEFDADGSPWARLMETDGYDDTRRSTWWQPGVPESERALLVADEARKAATGWDVSDPEQREVVDILTAYAKHIRTLYGRSREGVTVIDAHTFEVISTGDDPQASEGVEEAAAQ